MRDSLDLRAPDFEAKKLPNSMEAEQGLLGCVLYSPEAARALSHLPAEHFYEPGHEAIFAEIGRRVASNDLVEVVGLAERLKDHPAVQGLGGLAYFSDLILRAPDGDHAALAVAYAAMITSNWTKREAIRLCTEASAEAQRGASEGFEVLRSLRVQLEQLEGAAAPDDAGLVSARDAGFATLTRLETEIAAGKTKGMITGLSCIDRRLGGLLPESLVVMAGRPGMGKTALMGNALYGAALMNPSKIFAAFSLEMSSEQLSERALARLTAGDDYPIPFERIGKNTTTAFDLRRLHEVKEHLPGNLWLRDRAGLSLEDVYRVVWALKRRGDLGAIGIDYLQIMRRPRADGRNEASVVGEITTGLKRLAREARICVVLLSQLSRQVESREDKRPQLSDLRESGSIEQDADAVVFPFREVYYVQKAEPKEGTRAHEEWEIEVADKRRRMDVIIGKNRHGAEGMEPMEYDAEVDLIQNWRGSK